MKTASAKNAVCIMILITSIAVVMGVFFSFPHLAFAQERQSPLSEIQVIDGVRYISGLGIPKHARINWSERGVQRQSYAFKMPAAPSRNKNLTSWSSASFFGVSIDGVPIAHNFDAYWNDRLDWPEVYGRIDSYGGVKRDNGAYIYAGIPARLIDKDLSHVGYAADGFPIFVSKRNKFKPSYRLKTGIRPSGERGPGGAYSGRYVTDYEYVKGSGLLDRCNGVLVKKKYYIYILTKEFPRVPLCWRASPDDSFRTVLLRNLQKSSSVADEERPANDRKQRRRRR